MDLKRAKTAAKSKMSQGAKLGAKSFISSALQTDVKSNTQKCAHGTFGQGKCLYCNSSVLGDDEHRSLIDSLENCSVMLDEIAQQNISLHETVVTDTVPGIWLRNPNTKPDELSLHFLASARFPQKITCPYLYRSWDFLCSASSSLYEFQGQV